MINMPLKCCVPDCRGNYRRGPKVHVFNFPKDENLRKIWATSIPRSGFAPTKYSRVCHLHFAEEDIIRIVSQTDSRTGEVVTAYLSNPRLKATAVPTLFGNSIQNNFDLKPITIPKNNDEEVKVIKEEVVDIFEIKSEPENATCQELTCYDNFNDFVNLLSQFKLPQCWFVVQEEQKVIISKLIYSPGPLTSYVVVVNSNLKLQTFLYGQEIFIATDNFNTPFVSSSLDQISKLLEVIDKNAADGIDNGNENSKCILNHIINILGTVQDKENERISFISDQLKLHISSKERYRYSAKVMIFASILLTISAQAYQFLRHSGLLILPHPTSLKTLCNKFLTDPEFEDKQLFPNYARKMVKLLSTTEKHVILSVSEIDIKPYLDYKMNITTVYAFVISSVCSSFREVVHVAPTSRLNYENLHTFIKTVIVNLEEVGYQIFCVVCNTNTISGKAMSNFASNKKVSIVYPHPVTNNRPLFFLYDPVHLLKRIKQDWLNSKSNQTLTYPDFKTGTRKTASFSSIKKLHELERDGQSKLYYSLNLRNLFVSTRDVRDASLIQNIFNPLIVHALLQCEKNIENSKNTADFINIILGWWDIVNDNGLFKSQCGQSIVPEPIVAINLANSKLKFLENMLNWLETWKEGKFPHKLTPQTHSALYHTTHGMLEITKYCFEELTLHYVELGKFQTDLLEHNFGKHRHLTEGQYMSVRQLYESEKKLVVHLLLTLKSPSLGIIPIAKFFEDIDAVDEQPSDTCFNPTISINEDDFEEVKYEISAITYLAGYCCYAVLKKELNCEICKEKLVYPEELVVQNSHSVVENLKPGDLFYPHDIVVQLVLCTYVIFNNLLKHFEVQFFPIKNKLHLISQVILEYVVEEGYLIHFRGCENHSEEYVAKIIITWVTNTFLKNYYGKNRLLKSKKRKFST